MSYHIVHLLSRDLQVNLRRDQLQITKKKDGTLQSVPLSDIAVVVSASPSVQFSSSSLRRMAELNVVLLVCNEKFEPCSISHPYYRATSTKVLRKQVYIQEGTKALIWKQLVVRKIENQAEVLYRVGCGKPDTLLEIASQCSTHTESTATGLSLDKVTASQRVGLYSNHPDASESRAARLYWFPYLDHLSTKLGETERRREQGTRGGINGMLDYGYAILRSAILRSLAAHGFIAALGISHADRAGTFALADDIIEPYRPFLDNRLAEFIRKGGRTMSHWARTAADTLTLEIPMAGSNIRLLNVIDLTVRSLAKSLLDDGKSPLKLPQLKDLPEMSHEEQTQPESE